MDIIHETAISVIEDYKERLDDICRCCGYDFRYFSIAKWSIEELLLWIRSHPLQPPLVSIEEFSDKLKCCSEHNIIFSIAYDTSIEILKLF